MLNHSRYQKNINKGLDRAYLQAPGLSMDLRTTRLIIFSDQHKGTGDDADDFRPSEQTYRAALEHYLRSDYSLVILGDAEELWEDLPGPILEQHRSILALEGEFHVTGKYWRFWGNHDDEWRHPSQVRRYLYDFFQDINVLESLVISFYDGNQKLGDIYLVHGHQGSFMSDRLGCLTRIIARYLWRPLQRCLKIRINTPATDWRLRFRHDIAMYNWAADKESLILIAGHTHHPIFPSPTCVHRLTEDYQSVKDLSVDPEELAQARANLEFARGQEKPSYFNSGCCCFDDGSITGIEIVSGEIRLIRWPDEIGQPQPAVLDAADLGDVLRQTAFRATPMSVPQSLTPCAE